jgi:hypothetical protein
MVIITHPMFSPDHVMEMAKKFTKYGGGGGKMNLKKHAKMANSIF